MASFFKPNPPKIMKSKTLAFLLSACFIYATGTQASSKQNLKDLELFSYCSNGACRLITGEFFHNARGMPVDLNVHCKKNNQYALTFDDGPSKNYLRLLEILKRNNVKATFFIVGKNLENEDARQWFRQAFADGHFMANHTYNHNDLTALNAQGIVETIEKTRSAMIKTIYPEDGIQDSNKHRLEISSKVVRPPFGNINMSVDETLKANQYTSVRWNADRYDWNMPGNDPNTTKTILQRVEQQLNYIAQNAGRGIAFNQSILDLNHDWQPTTVDAVQDLITLVKSNGYEFVTLDQCLGS